MALTKTPSPKVLAAWEGLNLRQRDWLRVIYGADQDEEEYQKGAFNRGDKRIPASVWRWQEYEPTRRRRRGKTAKRGLLQERLDELEIRDPGAGSTIKVLAERGLIEVRYEANDPSANRMAIKLTTHGRAVGRAGGVDDTRPGRRNAARPLSESLWRMLAQVAAAGDDGLPPRYGYVHEAWQNLIGPGLVEVRTEAGLGTRLQLTDAGREHYRGEWTGYVKMYPAVNAVDPHGGTTWPVEVDRALRGLRAACRELAIEQRNVAEQLKRSAPTPRVVDKAAGPEVARATALHNRRVRHAVREHELLVEHRTELEQLRRAAAGRHLAVAAAVVTAVVEDADPLLALRAEPLVLGMTTDLPYPKVGVVGVDKDITTARPGTSHRRGKRAVPPPAAEVPTQDAEAYAQHLDALVRGGHLSRLLLRRNETP
jgi:hypothetical protein